MLSSRRLLVTLVATAAAIPTLAASAPAQQLIAPAIAPTVPATPSVQTAPDITATPADADPSADSLTQAGSTNPVVIPVDQLASIECIAKVVRHEAANQSAKGQLAVAQLIVNRTRAGSRFGHTACAVVNQPGQFFNTNSYNPDRHSDAWTRAVAASRDAVANASPAVVPGALFYHAAYQAPPRFFRGRQKVAVLGDHIFYR